MFTIAAVLLNDASESSHCHVKSRFQGTRVQSSTVDVLHVLASHTPGSLWGRSCRGGIAKVEPPQITPSSHWPRDISSYSPSSEDTLDEIDKMSGLRILVPIKRVIDYAVRSPNNQYHQILISNIH